MSNQPASNAGDFVCVATCPTPTEAHLLKGVLEANGLTPTIADANLVQAHAWMTQAVGGVRVRVPAGQATAAREAIAEFHAGAFVLEGEEESPTPTFAELKAPVFSPDRATVLSFVLTPAFGAALQLANAPSLGKGSNRLERWFWFVAMVAASGFMVAWAHRVNPGPFVLFRASLAMSLVTLTWYFATGLRQTRHLISTYGRAYPQRSLSGWCAATAVVFLAAGWALTEFT